MEVTVWNSDKQRLATIEVEFTKENTTWFNECTEEHEIYKLTDLEGGILISDFGYDYPVWIGGVSRADIAYDRETAIELIELYALH